MHTNKKLLLASQSPRRKQLLEWAELCFDIKVSNANEDYEENMPITEVPVFIATNKGKAVWQTLNEQEQLQTILLACDTVVVHNNTILGKPNSLEAAIDMLSQLSNSKHQVISGVYLQTIDKTISFYDITEVYFDLLNQQQIEHYVANYKPYDKAGSYAIQEWIGVIGIKRIEGDFYNVMGLPISKVLQALKTHFNFS